MLQGSQASHARENPSVILQEDLGEVRWMF